MTKKDYILGLILGVFIGFLAVPIFINLGVELPIAPVFIGLTLLTLFGLIVGNFLGHFNRFWWQFAKYGVVGVFNTLLDFGILNFLSYITQVYSGGLIILFNIVSFYISVTNSYFWNRRWTFEKEGHGHVHEYGKFLFVTFIGVFINTAIVYGLTTFVDPLFGVSPAVWENLAKLVGVPAALAWNFAGYRYFVFR